MNNTNKFIKTSIIYFIGNVLSKLMAFILIPIYTIYINTEIYGKYDLISSIISLVVPLVFFQIWDGLFRFIYDYKTDKDKYKVVSNGLIVFIFGIIIYEIFFIIVSIFIKIPSPIFVNFYGISYAAQYIFGTFSRTFKKNKLYMISGVVNTLVNLVSNIIIIVLLKYRTVGGLFLSIVLGNFVQCIIISLNLKVFKNVKIKDFDFCLIKKIIKFSIPIAISTISYWLLTGFTKVYISKNFGYSSNGIFAMATKLASFIVVIVSVLQMAWHESSFEVADNKYKKEYYEKGLNTFLAVLTVSTTVIMMLLNFFFPYIVKGEYFNAKIYMPIVLIYTAVNSFSGFSSSQFLAEKDSKVPLYTTLFAAILNVILLFMFKRFDVLGASISLLISFLLNTILRIIILNKKYNINISKRLLLYSSVAFVVSCLIYYLCNSIINLVCGLVLLIIIIIKYGKMFIVMFHKKIKN